MSADNLSSKPRPGKSNRKDGIYPHIDSNEMLHKVEFNVEILGWNRHTYDKKTSSPRHFTYLWMAQTSENDTSPTSEGEVTPGTNATLRLDIRINFMSLVRVRTVMKKIYFYPGAHNLQKSGRKACLQCTFSHPPRNLNSPKTVGTPRYFLRQKSTTL